jgi:hypothetical protein
MFFVNISMNIRFMQNEIQKKFGRHNFKHPKK